MLMCISQLFGFIDCTLSIFQSNVVLLLRKWVYGKSLTSVSYRRFTYLGGGSLPRAAYQQAMLAVSAGLAASTVCKAVTAGNKVQGHSPITAHA
jgi:hypothetical protein